MSKVIIKRCTPLGSKCTPHRPFVKWYRGVKRKRLHSDHFRITVEPVIVKKYRKTLVNRGFCKKKLDTRFDTHCIKTGVQLWLREEDLNLRPSGYEPDELPLLHPATTIAFPSISYNNISANALSRGFLRIHRILSNPTIIQRFNNKQAYTRFSYFIHNSIFNTSNDTTDNYYAFILLCYVIIYYQVKF